MAHRRQLIYVVTAYALCNSPRRSTLGGPPSDYVPVKHSQQGFRPKATDASSRPQERLKISLYAWYMRLIVISDIRVASTADRPTLAPTRVPASRDLRLPISGQR